MLTGLTQHTMGREASMMEENTLKSQASSSVWASAQSAAAVPGNPGHLSSLTDNDSGAWQPALNVRKGTSCFMEIL